jgi:hypothetical protein
MDWVSEVGDYFPQTTSWDIYQGKEQSTTHPTSQGSGSARRLPRSALVSRKPAAFSPALSHNLHERNSRDSRLDYTVSDNTNLELQTGTPTLTERRPGP